MALAIIIIAVGGLMVYSSLKGVSIADAFTGAVGNPLDPTGGVGNQTDSTGTGDIGTGGKSPLNTGDFKGPNAMLLKQLADIAEDRFNLRIGDICRDKNANYGSPTSLHKQCRAFDASGTAADMLAFARYAQNEAVEEVYYDPAGLVAPGYDHSDHVHVGA